MHVARLENAFEQQDGLPKTGIAQSDRIGQIEQRKTVCYVAKRPCRTQQAVTIRISLNDCPGFDRLPATGGIFFGKKIIMTNCGRSNAGLNWTRHG